MAMTGQPTDHPAIDDILLDEEELDDDDYERGFYTGMPRGAVRRRAEPRLHIDHAEFQQAYNDATAHALPSTGAKAVTSAATATSAEAMNSTSELCLYLMDTCDAHCTKTCNSCKPRWSHLPSPEAEKALIAQMQDQHGIVKRIDPKDDNKTTQVDVQNKHMKDILASVFDGYPGFHASLLPEDNAWVFGEPFDMFVGRWDQLREYRLRTPFAEEKAAWVSLVAAMTPVVQPILNAIKRIRDTGLVLWKDLPLIFPPGQLIIVEEPGPIQSVVRVLEGAPFYDPRMHQKVHRLNFEFIDWNGEMQGLRAKKMDIPEYAGHKKVKMPDLGTMPLDFCPSEEELRTKLIARGRRWSSLAGVEYKQFGGKKVPTKTLVPIEVSTYHRYE